MLRDGQRLEVRGAGPGDRMALRAFFDGLSPLSRYQRFFAGFPAIPDPLLEDFCRADDERHAGRSVRAAGRIIADGRLVLDDDDWAELAVVVSDDWHGRGIGRRLAGHLVHLALARGWRHLKADYLAENRRIAGLLRDTGFALAAAESRAGLRVARLAPSAAASGALAPSTAPAGR